MKYTKEQRLEIGKEVYEKVLGFDEAALRYDLDKYTIRDYFRKYKASVEANVDKSEGSYAGRTRKELLEEIMLLKVKLLLSEGRKPVEIVDELKCDFPIAALCKNAGISKVWYYQWVKNKSRT